MTPLTIDQAMQIAIRHQLAGRLPEAEGIYRQVLGQQPDHPQALHLLGVIAHETGRDDAAVELIGRAIVIQPLDPEARYNLGNALRRLGRNGQAIAAYRQAVALKPGFAEAWNNLGNGLLQEGCLDDAAAACSRAIALRPGYAEAYNNLGICLSRQGKLADAIAAGRTAVELKPDYAEAHGNLGAALVHAGELEAAIAACRRAVELQPGNANLHDNLGVALRRSGRIEEAAAAHRRAIAIGPNRAGSHKCLGNALGDAGKLSEAIAAYRHAMAVAPDDVEAGSHLIYSLHLHPAYGAAEIAGELRCWDHRHAQPLRRFIEPHPNDRDPERRLRIGYVSPDFREHAVGYNLLPLFRQHDRQQFEITCYSQAAIPDAMTRQFQDNSRRWRNTVGLSDEQVTSQIRGDGIDILVDLALHTAGNRLLVFARKPAPVQVTFAGYPGSTGLSAIDYRLSDPYLDPPGIDESVYSERTVRLPDTFWCYDPRSECDIPVNSLPALETAAVTFGCLNNPAKVNDDVLALWARVMQKVDGSRLLLLAGHGSHRQLLLDRLFRVGIEPERVEFLANQPRRQYLESYRRIDLGLDCFPYNGHTTSLDALWMGVPIVTLVGQTTAVSRGGGSQLSNLGLQSLAARTAEQFVEIAAELARDLPRLAGLRSTLRQRMEISPLMDVPAFARNIEAAYRGMWRAWCEHGPASNHYD